MEMSLLSVKGCKINAYVRRSGPLNGRNLRALSINTANPEFPMLPWALDIKWNANCWLMNAVTQISVAVSETRWRSYPVEADFSYENRNFLMLYILKTSFCVGVSWI
jgi:hypothetical protein